MLVLENRLKRRGPTRPLVTFSDIGANDIDRCWCEEKQQTFHLSCAH
jgi:hypothetical protein